jgi:uncharacterized protein DUF2314
MEDPRNIGAVCDRHAPKAGRYKDADPKTFIGKYVKLGFPSKSGRIEHMWVRVESIEGAELHGVLDNDPVLDVGFVCGDGVGFTVDEIEAVNGES